LKRKKEEGRRKKEEGRRKKEEVSRARWCGLPRRYDGLIEDADKFTGFVQEARRFRIGRQLAS
jgi:hypothetical protein